jgi:allophanate hydrolase subunit 1
MDAVTDFEVMFRTCYSYVAEICHRHQKSHKYGACCPGQAPSVQFLYEFPPRIRDPRDM